jgi:primosomal replication protein N
VFGPSGAPTLATLLHHPSAMLSAQVSTLSWLTLISLLSAKSTNSLQSESNGEFDEKT